MTRGVDIYRYQTVTDYRALARSVGFAWVKVTDGPLPAIVRGDAQVNGCKSAGIPVGGYHFAQRGDPIRQCHAFVAELRRLGALDLAPALDMEWSGAPDDEAKAFSIAFLRELMNYGYRPAIYMSASWAGVLRPDRWGIKGLVIWIAAYGANDGRAYNPDPQKGDPAKVRRHYPGRYDVHQHTSTAAVPGIRGMVDLNWALTGVPTNTTAQEQEEQDMDKEQDRKLTELHEALRIGKVNVQDPGVLTGYIRRSMVASEELVALAAADKGVDPEALAAAVVAKQRDLLEEVIREVVPDEVAEDVVRRLGEKLTTLAPEVS